VRYTRGERHGRAVIGLALFMLMLGGSCDAKPQAQHNAASGRPVPVSGQWLVAYSRLEGDVGSIWLLDAGTGERRQLTRPVGNYFFDRDPQMSPDQKLVACCARGRDIAVVSVNGGGATVIARGSEFGPKYTAPSFSPDGTKLCFQRDVDFRTDICVASVNGRGGMKQLTKARQYERFGAARFGPDGKHIIFRHDGGTHIMDPNGTGRRKLGPSEYALSSDGRQAAYAQAGRLFIMNADGTKRRQLASGLAGVRSVVFSHDGKRIAFLAECRDCRIRTYYAIALYVVASDGSALRRLTDGDAAFDAPQFSPDSSRLLYGLMVEDLDGKGTGNYNVYLSTIGVDGSNLRRLTYAHYIHGE